jgi:hypothetical protein
VQIAINHMMTNEIMIYINYIVGLKVHNKISLFFVSRKKIIAYIINKEKEKKILLITNALHTDQQGYQSSYNARKI